MSVVHGLSIDVECYYQIVWKDYLGKTREPTAEVERNTEWLLDCMRDAGVRGTYYMLGNVARAYPRLLRRIADEGHELGVHGDEHLYIYDLAPRTFHRELRVAIDAIEQASGQKVEGHRATAFSIVRETAWALDVIAELGLRYDSSIFPMQGRRYGIPDAPLGIHRLDNGLWEVPMTVVEAAGRRLPAGGGGYFRTFPYAYTAWALQKLEDAGRPAVTYFHPHEFELSCPRVGAATALRHPRAAVRLAKFNAAQSVGRGKRMRRRFARMLRDHAFVPVRDLLPAEPTGPD